MKFLNFINSVIITIGGLFIIFGDCYINNTINKECIIRCVVTKNYKLVGASTFVIILFTFLFFSMLSSRECNISNKIRGFLGSMLITFFFFRLLSISFLFYLNCNYEEFNIKNMITYQIIIFISFCALLQDIYRNLSIKSEKCYDKSEQIRIDI
ncbi:conserved protein, unknown function [Hepatocystis sp. ex Piliocolobus tephrosceles]|nr:conserved protein, unknown function [Hepatocystis sp. ex Piliocolobus tephrosceles]